MTRFSREEIYQEFMGNLAGTYKEMAYQLLEENRILREGLEFYADKETYEYPQCDEDNGQPFNPPDIEIYKESKARETLMATDSVGKEK